MIEPTTRTDELLLMRQDAIPRGLGTAHPIVLARGQGARVWDIEGKEYIDFIGGIGVLNVGHNHPRVVAAVIQQAQQLMHTSFQVAMYEPYIHLARALNRAMPSGVEAKSVLFTSGAEATENAIKIARAYTGRPGVVAFSHSFHGRTLLGMSLTGKANPYKQNFGPFAPEIYRAPYPYEYQGWTTEKALRGLHELFETQISPERVAAIIIEPVLGEGGFVPAPADYLRALRALCDEHGIVFIDDEIQSGFGRTGKLYAIEHSGVTPDLVTFAKSVGGGLPLSGVTGKSAIMDAPDVGGLGGTFGGNALACAAGLAVFDIFERDGLLARGQQIGATLRDAFETYQTYYPQIGDVRGIGPMLGLEFVSDPETRQPAPHLVAQIVQRARERGLLLLKAGMHGSVIRVLVPLVASDEDIEQALDIFEVVLADVLGQSQEEGA